MDPNTQTLIDAINRAVKSYNEKRAIYLEARDLSDQTPNLLFAKLSKEASTEAETFFEQAMTDFMLQIQSGVEIYGPQVLAKVWSSIKRDGDLYSWLIDEAHNSKPDNDEPIPTLEEVRKPYETALGLWKVLTIDNEPETLKEHLPLKMSKRGRQQEKTWALNVEEMPRTRNETSKTMKIVRHDSSTGLKETIVDTKAQPRSFRKVLKDYFGPESFDQFNKEMALSGFVNEKTGDLLYTKLKDFEFQGDTYTTLFE